MYSKKENGHTHSADNRRSGGSFRKDGNDYGKNREHVKTHIISDRKLLKLGELQKLKIVRMVDFGAYLGTEDENVLLPIKQVPDGSKVGDELEVFIYRDSSDRLIATTTSPKVTLGAIALLTVKDTTRIGAFLDWGLERDILMPFKEQTKQLHKGEQILAALYIDKSDRLAATMKLYDYIAKAPYGMYAKDTEVKGRIYELTKNFGAFVAVDDKYSGLIPRSQLSEGVKIHIGEEINLRITRIHEDGKMDLAFNRKAYRMLDEDGDKLMELLSSNGGRLEIGDKSSAEEIGRITGMSKNEFKRAVGHLYKMGRVVPGDNYIELQKS